MGAALRKRKVWIRVWVAEFLGVKPRTVSAWLKTGMLTSYSPEDVTAFLAQHPRVRNRFVRRLGVAVPVTGTELEDEEELSDGEG